MTVERLEEYGVTRMDDREIGDFLASQRAGILGLPATEAPYLLPLSYGFDGDSRLYFTFVSGPDSRKKRLSDGAESARFLVYSATSAYVWESVLLTGTIAEVPESDRARAEAALGDAWRPGPFESAGDGEAVDLYSFRIEDRRGIKHAGLPPGLSGREDDADG